MVVKFSKENTNYSKENIVQVLSQASLMEPKIHKYMMSNKYILKVEGDIHRSQWTADNTLNNYWFKIKVYDDDMNLVPDFSAVHIYVCFQTTYFDYNTQQYLFGNCINPPPKKNTDIADISSVVGFWAFVNISYNLNPTNFFFNTNNINKKSPPKRKNKRIDIIDPKTGKKIKIV
jgi:hypothetical protein